jgi:hypothetical protein
LPRPPRLPFVPGFLVQQALACGPVRNAAAGLSEPRCCRITLDSSRENAIQPLNGSVRGSRTSCSNIYCSSPITSLINDPSATISAHSTSASRVSLVTCSLRRPLISMDQSSASSLCHRSIFNLPHKRYVLNPRSRPSDFCLLSFLRAAALASREAHQTVRGTSIFLPLTRLLVNIALKRAELHLAPGLREGARQRKKPFSAFPPTVAGGFRIGRRLPPSEILFGIAHRDRASGLLPLAAPGGDKGKAYLLQRFLGIGIVSYRVPLSPLYLPVGQNPNMLAG